MVYLLYSAVLQSLIQTYASKYSLTEAIKKRTAIVENPQRKANDGNAAVLDRSAYFVTRLLIAKAKVPSKNTEWLKVPIAAKLSCACRYYFCKMIILINCAFAGPYVLQFTLMSTFHCRVKELFLYQTKLAIVFL